MKIAIMGTGFRRQGHDKPPQSILDVAAPGFDPRLVEQRLPSFPVNQINRNLIEISTIEAGLAAADKGFDAVYINTVGDYGLGALRSALSIPVIGAGQATMHAAAQLGERFSIVTIWPESLRFIYSDLLRLYGMEDHCVSVRCVSQDDELETLSNDENFVTEMRRGEITQQDRIVAECMKAIEEDRADTIMLGCTCMSPIAPEIAARVPAPVLNPLTTGYKAVEAQLSLQHLHSKLAYQDLGGDRLATYRAITDAVVDLDAQDEFRGRATAAE
jgi:allantoin racemase